MAITYENVIFDRVIDSLQTIIADEFNIQVYFDEHEGNQSFLITPAEDVLEDSLTSGQVRHYTVSIEYQLQSAGNYTKNSMKQVSAITERMKRLLYNNRNYTVSGTTQFYNGIVENIVYERDEEDQSILRSNTSFTCATMELV
jgi:hypothetical protein|tara:strand:- start:1241 stop:1669 length:429 start_codon:yes stop_codon:yes gene_type:complete